MMMIMLLLLLLLIIIIINHNDDDEDDDDDMINDSYDDAEHTIHYNHLFRSYLKVGGKSIHPSFKPTSTLPTLIQ